jgi:hypothetical protein
MALKTKTRTHPSAPTMNIPSSMRIAKTSMAELGACFYIQSTTEFVKNL